jgi:phage baseplate assembly protein W
MPLQVVGNNKAPIFTDIDPSLIPNPKTKDFLLVRDDAAIKLSIKNLLSTAFGERLFQPNIGASLKPMLFEPIDSISTLEIRDRIYSTIVKHEPRVENVIVDVIALPDENEYRVNLEYSIRAIAKQDKVSIVLERIR